MSLQQLFNHLRIQYHLDGLGIELVLRLAVRNHVLNLLNGSHLELSGFGEVSFPASACRDEAVILLRYAVAHQSNVPLVRAQTGFKVVDVSLAGLNAIEQQILHSDALLLQVIESAVGKMFIAGLDFCSESLVIDQHFIDFGVH